MLDLFGPDPAFAAPAVQILVGTTSIRLKIDKRGNVGNGTNLAPFMVQHLKERDWVPRLSTYVTINNYSVYDEKTGYAILPRYALEKLTEFLTAHGVSYELIPVAPVTPRPIKLKIKKNFSPREEQPKVIEFMTSDRAFKPISARTGGGKTFCSEVAMCEMGLATMIVLNSLIDQWYKSLRQHTTIASHEIYVIQGFEPLRKLWDAIKNGYRPKVVIFSTRTLVAYAVNPKGQYESLPSYAKFQEVLGIGMKIMDEVHLGFHANTKVDLMSNIANNIYLSATYDRNHYQGRRIFDMVFPRELRFGEEFQKKFTTVHMLRYRLGIPPDDCGRMRSPKGYNHALYENYLRRRPQYFNDFMDSVVVPIAEMFYLPVRKPGQLFLLLCQTRKFALQMEDYLKKWFAGRGTIAVYFSGEKGKNGSDKNLLADIIISTHKSCGTGRDIKNLKTCLNTVSFASAPLGSQVLGRLREIPGEDTIFVDIWNMDVGSHSSHRDSRLEVYKTKALKLFESTLR